MFQNHLESWKKTDFCPPFKIYWTWTRLRCASSPIRILCLQSRENCRKGRYLSLCLDLKIATFKLTKIVSLGEKCLERTLNSEITSLKAFSSLPRQVIMESLILRWCKKRVKVAKLWKPSVKFILGLLFLNLLLSLLDLITEQDQKRTLFYMTLFYISNHFMLYLKKKFILLLIFLKAF